jgi:hypothetical protein
MEEVQYSTVQYSTVQYSTVQYSTVEGTQNNPPIAFSSLSKLNAPHSSYTVV